jgi:AraC-like DNA-binding protein/signal transduction histidine kinase/ABC-type sugar transport system substrate-binding protein
MAESSNESPTLALVCASIHTGASRGLWSGFVDEALRRGSNVLCLPGGRLGASGDFESQRNSIFELATPANAAGIASWTTSLSGCVPAAEIESFIARFEGLPVVSLHQPVRGAPLIAFDGYRGMRALVEHLIAAHGYERIAFLRGPASHVSAEDRFRAYRDALAGHGIPYRPELVTEPLPWDAGAEAATSLLDGRKLRPGKDFRALVAASDLLAFWAMHEFLKRGFRVPEDLAVGGFNDSQESALSSPALSTVSIDFGREGGVAADLLLRRLEGQTPPPETILPAELRLRRSCGCPMVLLEDLHLPATGAGQGLGLPAAGPGRRAFVAELAELLGARGSRLWLEALVDSLQDELKAPGSGSFLAALEPALDRSSPEGLDPEGWQAALCLLRRRAAASLAGGSGLGGSGPLAGREAEAALDEVFQRATSLAAETSRRAEVFKHWQEGERTDALRRVGASLLVSHDLSAIASILARDLPGLGIPSAYLVLDGGNGGPARLVAASEAGRLKLEPGAELGFDPGLLLPPEVLPRGRNFAFIAEPLFFREIRIGRLVLEIGPRDGTVYEELRSYVSSALRGAALFGEAEAARVKAEKADKIKTRLLANLSRELCEPLERIISAAEALGEADRALAIKADAERQLVLIEDLLDLSRADSGELELAFAPVDLAALVAGLGAGPSSPPRPLPLVAGDPKRLEQVFRALAAVAKLASGGELEVEVRLDLPSIAVDILATGEAGERLTGMREEAEGEVAGLGLALSRRILALHGASLDNLPHGGFRLSFPLPSLCAKGGAFPPPPPPASAGSLSAFCLASSLAGRENALARAAGAGLILEPENLITLGPAASLGEGVPEAGGPGQPSLLVWDLGDALAPEWAAARSLRFNPGLSRLPLLAFPPSIEARAGQEGGGSRSGDFFSLLEAAYCRTVRRPALVIAGEESFRAGLSDLVSRLLPDFPRRSFSSPAAALGFSPDQASFILGGLPEIRAWLGQRRAEGRGGILPSIAFVQNKEESWEDLVEEAGVYLLPFGLLPPPALRAVFEACAAGSPGLPLHTRALVRKAELWIVHNYGRAVTRAELAEAVGANEDYLTRIFRHELGISPWEFLGRYRILSSMRLLEAGDESLAAVATAVGIPDQAYFSRVFRKFTGFTPLEYRAGRR